MEVPGWLLYFGLLEALLLDAAVCNTSIKPLIPMLITTNTAAVYAEWGTGLPRSGGEKNYLEFFFRRPAFFISCVYAANAALLGWPSGNSVFAGEMILSAAGENVTQWNQVSSLPYVRSYTIVY